MNIKKKVKPSRKFWAILSLILLIAMGSKLIASNVLSGSGQDLADLEKQVSELSRENNNLRLELSQKTSLSHISQEAEKLGFVEPSFIIPVNADQGFSAMAR